jgi:hypothetical protein
METACSVITEQAVPYNTIGFVELENAAFACVLAFWGVNERFIAGFDCLFGISLYVT